MTSCLTQHINPSLSPPGKFKQITLLNNLSSEAMLRAQIRRESCLKKARTMYRRLLVQSAQKSSQNSDMNNLRSSRKTNQVRYWLCEVYRTVLA